MSDPGIHIHHLYFKYVIYHKLLWIQQLSTKSLQLQRIDGHTSNAQSLPQSAKRSITSTFPQQKDGGIELIPSPV